MRSGAVIGGSERATEPVAAETTGDDRNSFSLHRSTSEPVGTRSIDDFRAIIESLCGGTAEATALANELLEVVEMWPSLSSVSRSQVICVVRADSQ